MSEQDDIDKLPLGTAEDHVFAWSLGNLDDGIVVENWKSQAMQMQMQMQVRGDDDGKKVLLPVVVLHVAGMVPNQSLGTVKQQIILIPHDIALSIAQSIERQHDRIIRNDRARLIANNNPPVEP